MRDSHTGNCYVMKFSTRVFNSFHCISFSLLSFGLFVKFDVSPFRKKTTEGVWEHCAEENISA